MTTQKLSEFDAAKAVADALQGLDKAQQERALRWASESLGLQSTQLRPAANPTTMPPAVHATPAVTTTPGGHTPHIDIRSFVSSKSPNSHIQLAATIAFFYKFIAPLDDRKETITATDLTDAIRKIGGWSQPKRPAMTLNNAKNQGYLDAVGSGSFRLNSVGENLVTMTLGADGTSESPKRPKKKAEGKKVTRKKKPSK